MNRFSPVPDSTNLPLSVSIDSSSGFAWRARSASRTQSAKMTKAAELTRIVRRRRLYFQSSKSAINDTSGAAFSYTSTIGWRGGLGRIGLSADVFGFGGAGIFEEFFRAFDFKRIC